MAPPAMTAAGARDRSRMKASHADATPHVRTVRRPPAPRVPRRVSGPLDGRAIPVPVRPRSPSRSRQRPAQRRARLEPLLQRAAAFVRSLPDHPLLDRIVRGRTWIVLLGVLLAGIVAMQVEMLKLGASIGRSIQLGTALQGRNELLRASVSSLSDAQRIERLALGMGMVMPEPTTIGFLDSSHIDPARAADSIHAPDPGAFQAAQGAVSVGTTGTSSAGTTGTSSAGTTGTGTGGEVAAPSDTGPASGAGPPAAGSPSSPGG